MEQKEEKVPVLLKRGSWIWKVTSPRKRKTDKRNGGKNDEKWSGEE